MDNGDGDPNLGTHGLCALRRWAGWLLGAHWLHWTLSWVLVAVLARIGLVQAQQGTVQAVVVIRGYEDAVGKL